MSPDRYGKNRIDFQARIKSGVAAEVEGKGLLVFVDGYTTTHVSSVKQDLEDIFTLRKDLDIVVVTTTVIKEHLPTRITLYLSSLKKAIYLENELTIGEFCSRSKSEAFRPFFIPQWFSLSALILIVP